MKADNRTDLQREIATLAGELEQIARRLERIADSLPEPAEAVLEGDSPWTLDAELKGSLYCIADGDVRGASEDLSELASATAESVS